MHNRYYKLNLPGDFHLLEKQLLGNMVGILRLTFLVILFAAFSFLFSFNIFFFMFKGVSQHFSICLMRLLSKGILTILGVPVIYDEDNLIRSQRKINNTHTFFLCNHISYLDILIISAHFHTTFVAKIEVEKFPIIGTMAKLCGVIFVDRFNLQKRVRTLKEIQKNISRTNICIFPEGTTTTEIYPKELLWKFNHLLGSKEIDTNLQVLGISYGKDTNECAWINDDTLFDHLWKMATSFNKKAAIVASPLLKYSSKNTENTKKLSQQTYKQCCYSSDYAQGILKHCS